ncbi:hypothetical protein RI129_003274 [Pyrocoelia pectoralis]|uniref:Helix-turn-helix domain-containing protein n=1 Tax=Pyrocoelia pectoralis TaxID=417401 RepID=A0AAN7ZMV8_9COLE
MLPFLDLCLHKSPHIISFSIYRKPTTTDNLIPFDSIHPFSHKLAGLNALLFRLFKIPMSPTHFNDEYNIIKQIAWAKKSHSRNPLLSPLDIKESGSARKRKLEF